MSDVELPCGHLGPSSEDSWCDTCERIAAAEPSAPARRISIPLADYTALVAAREAALTLAQLVEHVVLDCADDDEVWFGGSLVRELKAAAARVRGAK